MIVILTLGTSYEVFVRYVFNAPTTWAFDLSYIMYGALFFMAGAYTLSRGGHVRADMLYRIWQPRTQASVDLVLYVLFFFPGSWPSCSPAGTTPRCRCASARVSIFSPAGVPICPLKTLIPFGAAFCCCCRASPKSSAASSASAPANGRTAA